MQKKWGIKLFKSLLFNLLFYCSYRLIDGINTLDTVVSTMYHDVKVVDAIKKSFWEEELAMVATFTQ